MRRPCAMRVCSWLAAVMVAPLIFAGEQSGSATEPTLRVGAAAVSIEADDSMVLAGGIGPRLVQGQEGQLRRRP